MMVVPSTLGTFREFISGSPIAEVEFENKAYMHKQFQGAINGRKPNIGLNSMDGKVHLFSAQMLLGVTQHIKDCFPGDRDPITPTPEPTVPPIQSWITSLHTSTSAVPAIQSF
jgi:hypothetical protein